MVEITDDLSTDSESMHETIRQALLRKVFSAEETQRQFDAKLARICVLFEDLRIEINGISEHSLPALDVLDSEKDNWLNPAFIGRYRSFYFLRRSFLTFWEFAEALRLIAEDIERDPALKPAFRGLTEGGREAWAASVAFFRANEKKIKEIRGDIGGHFGNKAALNAVSRLLPTARGSIALAHDIPLKEGGTAEQLKLHFSLEVAGSALLQHLPDHDIAQYEALFTDFVVPGYEHAINSVYVLVREYLWDRFG
jgi:hypothetical protein